LRTEQVERRTDRREVEGGRQVDQPTPGVGHEQAGEHGEHQREAGGDAQGRRPSGAGQHEQHPEEREQQRVEPRPTREAAETELAREAGIPRPWQEAADSQQHHPGQTDLSCPPAYDVGQPGTPTGRRGRR